MTPNCIQQTGEILSNETIAHDCKEIHIHWDGTGPTPRPGQFLTILPDSYPLTLLRRPFAYSDVGESSVAFIYEIRGSATRDLASMNSGGEVNWIGPLGSFFPLPDLDQRPILVAGGAGIGPMYFFSVDLVQRGFTPLVIVGNRSADFLPSLNWPPEVELRLCTEDGSTGITGTVLDGVSQADVGNAAFYSCGPLPMMTAIHHLAVDSNRPSWVSMEEMMACGVGACQGCAVPVVDQNNQTAYKRACLEGSVFDSRIVKW